MRKVLGILGILVAVFTFASFSGPGFLTGYNLSNLTQRSALQSIIALGAAIVIATGGIELSIGSVVCLAGIAVPWLLVEHGWSPWLVVPVVLAGSALIGLAHGLLVTRLRLQPFLVTLCGLLLYRGIAGTTPSQVEIGCETDFEFFQRNGSSVANTVNDSELSMNNVHVIYDRDALGV
ncbi:MAG: ABC transporter permease, partial [Phycisphaerales bacterium]